MAPAAPESFAEVDVEIVTRTTPMLGMRASELALSLVLQRGAVVLSDRSQIGLPGDRHSSMRGFDRCGQVEHPLKVTRVVTRTAFVQHLDELAIFEIHGPWRPQDTRQVSECIECPAAPLPCHDERIGELPCQPAESLMLDGIGDEGGFLEQPIAVQPAATMDNEAGLDWQRTKEVEGL